MGESPRWHDGALWLCDWLAGEVLTIDAEGAVELVRRIGGLPFSVDWLPDGREIYTTHEGVVVGPDLAPTAVPVVRGTRSSSTRVGVPS